MILYLAIYNFFRRKIVLKKILKLIKSIDIKRDDIVVDIAGGTGFLSDIISSRYILLDISMESLKFAKRKGISTCRGDAHSLPVKDESIDIIFSINSLHHLYNPSIAIIEMNRILKMGGKIFILDFNRNTIIGRFMSIYEKIMSHNARLLTIEELSNILSKTSLKGEFKTISKSSFLYIGEKT